MAKSAADWDAPPKFPATHYVDSRIYTDEAIFEEEKEKLFKPSWIIACHESEIANPFDYRLFTHPSGVPLLLQHLPAPRQHHPVRPGRQR
jgi:methanesulfonate monooxygenase large subunit